MKNIRTSLFALGFVFWLLYFLAFLFPEELWGLHQVSFLPDGLKYPTFCISGILIFVPLFPQINIGNKLEFQLPPKAASLWIPLTVALMGGMLFYSFPMHEDLYGDARFIVQELDIHIDKWSLILLENFLQTDFLNPKVGGDSVIHLACLLAACCGQTVGESLLLINYACGMAYLFLWFRLTAFWVPSFQARLLGYSMGLSAPFLLFFAGHYEFYAPVYVSILAYLYCLLRFTQTHSQSHLVGLCFFLLLSIKFHITSYLLLLPLGICLWEYYGRAYNKFLSWKKIFSHIMLPLFSLGLLLYFIVLESYDGPRNYSEVGLEDALLLPLYTLEDEVFRRYNLFSWNHILDYGNLPFLCSPVAVFCLLWMLVFSRREWNWELAALRYTGLVLMLYTASFFFLNPLLSMPIDWDLFAIPAIPLKVLTLLFIGQIRKAEIISRILAPSLGIAVLSLGIWVVHGNNKSLSGRMEAVGNHIFKTYWKGATTSIYASLELLDDEIVRQDQLLKTIGALEAYAVKGEDIEYADLLCQAGLYYFRKDPASEEALDFFNQAYQYKPSLSRNVYHLLLSHFMRKEYKKAHSYSKLLLGVRYPSHQKAFRLSIHTAIMAKAYRDAEDFSQVYLELWPSDSLVSELYDGLKNGEEKDKLAQLFHTAD